MDRLVVYRKHAHGYARPRSTRTRKSSSFRPTLQRQGTDAGAERADEAAA